ncbi:hypothetical protein [Mesobacillus zeae]|uniref:Uncharacterized protein n=1 Tax=Mesobacillus zeae TaxID=1917180 RepID=A0A398B7W0_9BACI|nr:hypothetical protein [Mesobacillus zeae]RID85574.1 hypothetical protein D1970_08410 [Mesobacillus zeae]
MRESKNCYHRFSVHEENLGFITNDGIDLFVAGSRFQKCISCGHMEFMVETSELIEEALNEKRNEPQTPKNLYYNLIHL